MVFGVGEGARCDEVYSMRLFETGFVEFLSDVASDLTPVVFWLWELIPRAYALSVCPDGDPSVHSPSICTIQWELFQE